jgi:hypothetical protein
VGVVFVGVFTTSLSLFFHSRSSASGCEDHQAYKHRKQHCHDNDPNYRGDKSVSAMRANPHVQSNGLLAGGASLH